MQAAEAASCKATATSLQRRVARRDQDVVDMRREADKREAALARDLHGNIARAERAEKERCVGCASGAPVCVCGSCVCVCDHECVVRVRERKEAPCMYWSCCGASVLVNTRAACSRCVHTPLTTAASRCVPAPSDLASRALCRDEARRHAEVLQAQVYDMQRQMNDIMATVVALGSE